MAVRARPEGLERLRERLDDPSILDDLTANPIPGLFEIRTGSAAASAAVVAPLDGAPGIDPLLGVVGPAGPPPPAPPPPAPVVTAP